MTKERIFRRMAIQCSKREYTPYDIRNKLLSWKVAVVDVDYVVDKLIEEGYIDEMRYSRAFAHDKFLFNGWGRLKIAANLRAKSISEEIIRESLSNITDEQNRQRLRDIITAKLQDSQDTDLAKLHTRTMRMCLQHGFEQSLVIEEMNNLFPQNKDAELQSVSEGTQLH